MLVQSTSFIALVFLVARGHNLIKAKCKVLARGGGGGGGGGGVTGDSCGSLGFRKCVLCFIDILI